VPLPRVVMFGDRFSSSSGVEARTGVWGVPLLAGVTARGVLAPTPGLHGDCRVGVEAGEFIPFFLIGDTGEPLCLLRPLAGAGEGLLAVTGVLLLEFLVDLKYPGVLSGTTLSLNARGVVGFGD
jgi:hypothetical protein